ncbi:MAG: hypothetical protein HXY24_18550 [Rubrivivax sp.]|nr:hypothetical protein [Rubrivivax sp.]
MKISFPKFPVQKILKPSSVILSLIFYFVSAFLLAEKSFATEVILELHHAGTESPYLYTDIYLNTNEKDINSIQIDLQYTEEVLKASDIYVNPDLCSTSPEKKLTDDGFIKFFCSTYEKNYDETIATIKFKTIGSGKALLEFMPTSSVYESVSYQNILGETKAATYEIDPNIFSLPETGEGNNTSLHFLLVFIFFSLLSLFFLITSAIWGAIYLSIPSRSNRIKLKKINPKIIRASTHLTRLLIFSIFFSKTFIVI